MTIVYSTNIKTRKRDYSNGFFFNKYYLLKKIKKVFVLQQRLLPSFSLVLLQSFETLTVKTIKLVLPSPQPRVSVSPAMASSIQGLVPAACPGLRSRRLSHPSSSTSSFSVAAFPESGRRFPYRRKMVRKAEDCGVCRVMVQQAAVQGASAAYAKEMERLSAKESLLLAEISAYTGQFVKNGYRDQRSICQNNSDHETVELGPTLPIDQPHPSRLMPSISLTSLAESPPIFITSGTHLAVHHHHYEEVRKADVVSSIISQTEPEKPRSAQQNYKFHFCSIYVESKFVVSTQLSVEGPLRMKEEYVEAVLELPKVDEESVPEQLRGAFGQAVSTVQQLPGSIRDAVARGLKVPLSGTFQRLFMISYLDEEILIIRDSSGLPEVLTRLDTPPSSLAESTAEYES
ncbi:hypothetical protein RHMOL_Rhmol04G0133000 [Rhododendron molle]|uniref:Uncharacterized protein n=1 Tax=Rhododendron molle TaxID=49168 RepID=A0ACC0P2F0_RHOML|nr:hypothetical protein RHMOL_Rhmol04G0133000 [Rhododendron molle]